MQSEFPSTAPVLIVGAGPVGLTMANMLVARGVDIVVVERNPTTSEQAKAISLDDESLRSFQTVGLAEQVEEVVVPGTGTRYYDRRGRPLFHARGARPYRLGFAFKNQFAQRELEVVLADAVANRGIDIRFNNELIDLTEHGDHVVASVRSVETGAVSELTVGWVLGCDGGRSTVRQLTGITMTGTSHQQTWLVVDTLEDHHRERYGMHHGDPRRPAVVIPGRDGRCRYEFRLWPGEGEPGEEPSEELIAELVAPHRTLAAAQVERSVNYRFNAVVAEAWRHGRCFLLGDAAHMMPPFAGQGLNSGVRDAANLAWKLAMVWHGELTPDVLDSYELERRPHATALVKFSERLGSVVMTTSRPRALVRDLAVRALMLLPAGRRYLREMRFRPKARHEAGIVVGQGPLVGLMIPQPWVILPPTLRLCRMDEVLGPGIAVVGVNVPPNAWDLVEKAFANHDLPDVRRVDVVLDDQLPTGGDDRVSIADADGGLEEAFAPARGKFVVVKPDRYVAAVLGPDEADEVAAALSRWLNTGRGADAGRRPARADRYVES